MKKIYIHPKTIQIVLDLNDLLLSGSATGEGAEGAGGGFNPGEEGGIWDDEVRGEHSFDNSIHSLDEDLW